MPSAPSVVRIHLFAAAREAVGASVLVWALPARGMPAEALVRRLAAEHPKLRRTLRASRFVRNGEYLSDLKARIRPGDEFAVHPPYGGG